ncbi:MAG: RagB/SusD family nutrient uptake outer membrane protein [Bacteroidales bacterium]|nr:RagB/SusD family nutrient uptake outer membrane protein [Bacteroidales bacterium]
MKKTTYIAAFAGLVGLMSAGCSDDFLKEELITQQNTDYLKTTDGIDDLSTGCYFYLKAKFGQNWVVTNYNMGTDEMTDGNKNQYPAWNCYSADLNSGQTYLQSVWDNMFSLVEPANQMIAFAQAYNETSYSARNTRIGEGYFFRAWAYFELVRQFGGVPLKLAPSTGANTYFVRNTEEECYAQIIADLEEAYRLLPEVGKTETPTVYSARVSKAAAAHYLAKAHLFRASELYDSWNGNYKASDLDAVIKYGSEVYETCGLASDYSKLWNFDKPNSDCEKEKEIVLAAQFYDTSSNTSYDRFTNQAHLHFITIYNDVLGCKRDVSGGREFGTASTTTYSVEVFDRLNDSRFWKSFVTVYGCNNTAGAPVWNEADAAVLPEGAVAGERRFEGGMAGIKYIVNTPGDSRYERYVVDGVDESANTRSDIKVLKNGKLVPEHTMVMYFNGEKQDWNNNPNVSASGNIYNTANHMRGVALSKYRDGSKQGIAGTYGTRDGILARSAEDVLMVAEAYVRKNDFASAVKWVNYLRERAGYAEGEDRSVNVDGGQAYLTNASCTGLGGGFSADGAIYMPTNTYYESNNLDENSPLTSSTKSALMVNGVDGALNSPVDMPIYEALGLSSDYDKMLCFILNERTRELCGELHRWEDLARTKTLESRWRAFNEGAYHMGADFNADKHYYRPIPQSFLDDVTTASGSALTDEQKAQMQNPGY